MVANNVKKRVNALFNNGCDAECSSEIRRFEMNVILQGADGRC
jgi:hypothetical protein